MIPETLIRISDGELFTLDYVGTRYYKLKDSMKPGQRKFTYAELMETGNFEVA